MDTSSLQLHHSHDIPSLATTISHEISLDPAQNVLPPLASCSTLVMLPKEKSLRVRYLHNLLVETLPDNEESDENVIIEMKSISETSKNFLAAYDQGNKFKMIF